MQSYFPAVSPLLGSFRSSDLTDLRQTGQHAPLMDDSVQVVRLKSVTLIILLEPTWF